MFARAEIAAIGVMLAGCASVAPPPDPVAVDTSSAYYPAIENRGDSAGFLTTCEDFDEWDKPAPPFQIFGNTFYVGTCGISAILVAGEEGHVLIDSGTDAGAKVVLDNIRALGFDPRDVRYLLHSHDHFDHVGGHARIVAETGATVIASPRAAKVLKSGNSDPDDPQSGLTPVAPVATVRAIADGAILNVGDLELTAHFTPGHTPGAMSWTWAACSQPRELTLCRKIAYVDSLSPIAGDGFRFSDQPHTVAAFRTSIQRVRALPCDLLLTPHPSASDMLTRMRGGELLGEGQCPAYADNIAKRLDARLAEETGE